MAAESSGFGYPHMRTLAMCSPFSGRPLPPELPIAYKLLAPPMNMNVVYLDTHAKPIDWARNWFAEKAIENNAKYLFFWDEDVLVPAHALRELMYIADNWPNVGVIGGIYCLKSDRPEPLVFKGTGTGPYWDWRVGEVFECTAIGMGCTLIRTDVFKDIEKPWFRSVDDFSPYLDHIPQAEQWTEDLYFCHKVTDTKKWKIVAHGQLVMPHIDVRTGKRYELPADSKPARHLLTEVGKLKIIDIGSGTAPIQTNEGKVITVDIREGADYRCDFRRLPFATGEFDIVHSSHALEHVPRAETESTLDEWIRVMKPGGELRLLLPNIEWAAKKIVAGDYGPDEKDSVITPLDVIYAQQQYPEDFHKNGFTPKLLTDMLKKRGFKKIEIETPAYHIYCRAWKIPPKEVKKRGAKKIQSRPRR